MIDKEIVRLLKADRDIISARMEKEERLIDALKEYQHSNPILNDLDAYLYELGKWGLGEEEDKPTREKFGIK